MLKTTRWSPNTCGCIIEYTWDTDVPDDQRVHSQKSVIPCPEHSIDDHPSLMARVLEEQGRIAVISTRLATNYPAIWEAIQDGMHGERISFSGRSPDNRRVLVVSIPNMTVGQRSALQSWAVNRLGAGTVVIQG